MAFVAPRAGTLTDLSAMLSVTTAVTLTGAATVNVQLYSAPSGSNTFSPVAGTLLTLPPLVGIIAIGTVTAGALHGLAVPITTDNRYLLVYSLTSTGTELVDTIVGFASAGLNIT